MIYFIVFLILLFLPKNKKSAAAVFVLILGSISALRYNVGYDYENYMAVITGESEDYSYDRLEWTSKVIIDLARYLDSFSILDTPWTGNITEVHQRANEVLKKIILSEK